MELTSCQPTTYREWTGGLDVVADAHVRLQRRELVIMEFWMEFTCFSALLAWSGHFRTWDSAHVNISHYFLIWSAKLQPLALNCSFFDSSALQSSCTTATISIPFVIAVWDPSIRMMTNVLASLFGMMDTHYKAANSISEFGFPIFISKFSSRIAPARY